jgi:hypothetical protein
VIKDFIRRDVAGTWRMTGMVKLPLDMDANNVDFVFAIGDYAMQTTDAFWMGYANRKSVMPATDRASSSPFGFEHLARLGRWI